MSLLQKKLKNKKIILASASPRRSALLRGLDIPFTIKTKDVNEIYNTNLQGSEITEYLARLKADAFTKWDDESVLITADTIVWYKEKAVMKPKNKKEAFKILSELSGNSHEVFTSVCIKSKKKTIVLTDRTEVIFGVLTPDEIDYYIEKHKPYDKAGGYGVQEWIGYIGIESIKGSYYNVMGFPIHKVYRELLKF